MTAGNRRFYISKFKRPLMMIYGGVLFVFVAGGGSMLNVLANQVMPPPPPYQGRNRHFEVSECLYALFYGIITAL